MKTRNKVIPIKQLPPDDVANIIAGLPARNFKKLVIVGQTEEGWWNFQMGSLSGKVEALGVMEFIKMEIWESMQETTLGNQQTKD